LSVPSRPLFPSFFLSSPFKSTGFGPFVALCPHWRLIASVLKFVFPVRRVCRCYPPSCDRPAHAGKHFLFSPCVGDFLSLGSSRFSDFLCFACIPRLERGTLCRYPSPPVPFFVLLFLSLFFNTDFFLLTDGNDISSSSPLSLLFFSTFPLFFFFFPYCLLLVVALFSHSPLFIFYFFFFFLPYGISGSFPPLPLSYFPALLCLFIFNHLFLSLF